MCQVSARHVFLLCPRELDTFRVRVTAIDCRVRLCVGCVTFVVFFGFPRISCFLRGSFSGNICSYEYRYLLSKAIKPPGFTGP
jgi:hypothetical protein